MPSTSLPAADREKRLARLDRMANALDSKFRLFGISFGWDSLLGLIPGVGAVATALPGAVMIAEAARLGARKRVLTRMALNTGADVMIGTIPVIGDAFDVAFKSHQRSLALLKSDMARLDNQEEQ